MGVKFSHRNFANATWFICGNDVKGIFLRKVHMYFSLRTITVYAHLFPETQEKILNISWVSGSFQCIKGHLTEGFLEIRLDGK